MKPGPLNLEHAIYLSTGSNLGILGSSCTVFFIKGYANMVKLKALEVEDTDSQPVRPIANVTTRIWYN